MQLICISRGTHDGGKQLAEALASNLGYAGLSREELSDGAAEAGIALGRLEMAVVRRRPFDEQLAIEKERFKAFVVSTIGGYADKRGLVYHGRAGHLTLPAASQALRIRAIMNSEMRAVRTMARLKLSRTKALAYNAGVDEDRHRWVRTIYNVDWEDPKFYDIVVNLSRVNVANAAAALVPIAQLPEFQATPATLDALNDTFLAARCRVAIGADPRTRRMDAQLKVEHGRVIVTYLPRQAGTAHLIPEVLSVFEEIQEIVCTMATTNVLWIQERWGGQESHLTEMIDIAGRWGAAIQLLQLSKATKAAAAAEQGEAPDIDAAAAHGGILDDTDATAGSELDDDVKQTIDRLISAGRAGGHRSVQGGAKELLESLDRTTPYSLVVVGDLFLDKEASVRKRLAREIVGYLSDNLRVPVIGIEEMRTEYIFGANHWARLLLSGAGTLLALLLVFSHQLEVLTFMSAEGTLHRVFSTACLFAFVPLFAYCYGTFTRQALMLLKFE